MMNLNDIVQLGLLSAVVFFTLGYLVRRFFPRWLHDGKNLFLSPRYLKSAGVWRRDRASSTIDK